MKTYRNDIFNAYKFFAHGINKFILFLRQDVYPYEYMDDWKKFNETLLPEKQIYKIPELDPDCFLDAPELARQAAIKRPK